MEAAARTGALAAERVDAHLRTDHPRPEVHHA